MGVARVIRLLLALACVLVVVWSFVDVGRRTINHIRPSLGQAQLTVLFWGTPEEKAIVEQLVAAFEASHPHVRIQPLHAPDYDAKLKTMMAAGTPPDLFYLKPEDVSQFADNGMLYALDDFVAAEHTAGEGDWIDDFYPVLLNAYRWDEHRRIVGVESGTLYGLPKDFTTAVMYVNLDLFQRAGVEVPYDGWTWDQYRDAMARIASLSDERDPSRRIWGGVLRIWWQTFRNLVWSCGGDFFGGDYGGDFFDVVLDEPGAQQMMQFIRTVRMDDRSVFNATGLTDSEDDLFRRGQIGALGPYGRWFTPRCRRITAFDWDVVPVPHARDAKPVSELFSVAWGVSSQTAHPEEALQLLKFLCGEQGQRMTAELGLAIPSMRSVAESQAFLDPNQKPANTRLFLDLIEHGRVGQNPQRQEFIFILESVLRDTLVLDSFTPAEAAAEIERQWLNELASPLYQKEYPPMPWGRISLIMGLCIVTALLIAFWFARRQPIGRLARAEERVGWMFVSPWIIGFLLFVIGPIVLAFLLSMTKWTAMAPLTEARFVGLDNYKHLAQYDERYLHALWVTTYYTVLAVPLVQIAALLVALLMNLEVKTIGIFRTLYFLPSVITGVALVTLWIWMFDNDRGFINRAIEYVGLPAPDWFGVDGPRFAVPALVIMALWGVGGGMVIYLAGLKNIPQTLYEAARIDGAGPIRQFFSVTLPMLSPLIFFNLVMSIIGSFQVFTQAYVITASTGGRSDDLLVYVLYLYRQAFENHNMGYASALAWILFLLLVVLTALVFRGSRGLVHYEGLKQ